MKKYKIVQIGMFDSEIYGNLLFPAILENELKKRVEIEKIYLFSPKGGKLPFFDKKIYPLCDLENIIKKESIDVIIIGGGDLIRLPSDADNSTKNINQDIFNIWQIPILLGKKYNIKVIFNAVGVPSEFTENQLSFINLLLEQVDYLTVRDEFSKYFLGYNIKDKCIVVPDLNNNISNLYSKEDLLKNMKEINRKNIASIGNNYIILQIDNTNNELNLYKKRIIELINYITIVEKKKVLILPASYKKNDIAFYKEISDSNKRNIIVVKEKLHPYDMVSLLVASKGYVGTDLCSLIISNAYNVPIMAINTNYFVRISGFMESIRKRYLEINDINECLLKYKLYFSNQSFIYNSEVKKILSNHFDKIKTIILKPCSNLSEDFEYNFLNYVYKLIGNYEKEIEFNDMNNKKISFLQNEVSNLLNSKSFKITAPLRKITNTINKIISHNYNKRNTCILKRFNKKIAIQIHVFYPELLEELYSNLEVIPYKYDLYVSTNSEFKQKVIQDFFNDKHFKQNLVVETFENRGRDIYPFLAQLKDRIKNYDYVLHLHTKKSFHCLYGDDWRKYLYYNLLGNKENIANIFYKFEKNKKLGLIFPETYIILKGRTLLGGSKENLDVLCKRMKINEKFSNIFPAGSMFWAKVEAILPLFSAFDDSDFDDENNQVDGTFAHAVERVFVILAKSQGYDYLQIINKTEELRK